MTANKVPYVVQSALDIPIRKRRRLDWRSFVLGMITGVGGAAGVLLWRGVI